MHKVLVPIVTAIISFISALQSSGAPTQPPNAQPIARYTYQVSTAEILGAHTLIYPTALITTLHVNADHATRQRIEAEHHDIAPAPVVATAPAPAPVVAPTAGVVPAPAPTPAVEAAPAPAPAVAPAPASTPVANQAIVYPMNTAGVIEMAESIGASPGVAQMLGCIAWAESTDQPWIVNAEGYAGLYQFGETTWVANGGVGAPQDQSPLAQTIVAYHTYLREGWSPWSGDGCVG